MTPALIPADFNLGNFARAGLDAPIHGGISSRIANRWRMPFVCSIDCENPVRSAFALESAV